MGGKVVGQQQHLSPQAQKPLPWPAAAVLEREEGAADHTGFWCVMIWVGGDDFCFWGCWLAPPQAPLCSVRLLQCRMLREFAECSGLPQGGPRPLGGPARPLPQGSGCCKEWLHLR